MNKLQNNRKLFETIIGISIMAIFVVASILTNRGLLAANNVGSWYGYGYGYGPGNFPQQKTWNQAFGGDDSDLGTVIRQTKDGGYVILGNTSSQGAGSYDFWLQRFNKDGVKEWEKTFGGGSSDFAQAMELTPDGGYILVGSTSSYGSGGDTLIVKVDAEGNILWQKNYGGSGSDNIEAIKSVRGGYILSGWTTALDPFPDAWILQIDESGNKKWEKTTGGSKNDYFFSVDTTSDGGYIFAGNTDSRGAGCMDGWLLKTDSHGAERWSKLFGGSECNMLHSVDATSDGGYIIGGYNDGSFWMIKTNDRGEKIWEKTFGGSNPATAGTVFQTFDGGYAIAGYIYSLKQDPDGWIVKTDKNGTEEWNQTYGGNGNEILNDFIQTKDGGFAFTGQTPVLENSSTDLWFVKTDREGNAPEELQSPCEVNPTEPECLNWNYTFGSSKEEKFFSLVETKDAGAIFVGYTTDTKTGFRDGWIVKTNIKGEKEWDKKFGDRYNDEFHSVKMVSDGYIVAGHTVLDDSGSSTDGWLVKLDFNGRKQWDQRLGGGGKEFLESVNSTSDGGFILAGNSDSQNSSHYPNFWLIKTNSYGNVQWEKNWSYGSYGDFAYAAEEIAGNNYMMTGYSFQGGESEKEGFVMIVDLNGNIVSTKFFGGAGSQVFYDGIETSDGGFAFSGYTEPVGTMDAWVVRTDKNLQKIWESKLSLSEHEYAESIRETADHGFIVSGASGDASNSLSDGLAWKLSSNGKDEWQKTYNIGGNDIFKEGIQHSSGNYLFGGSTNHCESIDGYDGWGFMIAERGSYSTGSCGPVPIPTL